MALSPALTAANRASWEGMLRFVDEFPDDKWRDWKTVVRPTLEASIRSGIAEYFRAGQSVHHLIFSTAEKHGLEDIQPSPPRVTFGLDDDGKLFVGLSRYSLFFNPPDRKQLVDRNNAFVVLKSFLSELWQLTRPNEPLPSVVA
jgi:hypothetical protein